MGTRIIVGYLDDGLGIECACFYDSVTATVFGKVMDDLEEAESFEKWVTEEKKLYEDLRQIPNEDFENLVSKFRRLRE